jgi:hypothetical protein
MSMFPVASFLVSGSSTGTISFNNIPKSFTNLQVRVFGRGTTSFSPGLSLYVTPIGLSVSSSKRHYLTTTGTTPAVSTNSDASAGLVASIADGGATSNVYSNTILDILDWASETKNITLKGISGFDTNANGATTFGSSLLVRSSGTITGFNFFTDGNWIDGSRIDVYGISTSSQSGA